MSAKQKFRRILQLIAVNLCPEIPYKYRKDFLNSHSSQPSPFFVLVVVVVLTFIFLNNLVTFNKSCRRLWKLSNVVGLTSCSHSRSSYTPKCCMFL